MKWKEITVGQVTIHFIKTEKFRTVYTLITLSEELTEETLTKRIVLADMLGFATEKYPNRRSVMLAREDLYSASLLCNTRRNGKYHEICISLTALSDKYTEEGNLENTFAFLNEVLFHPLIQEESFNEEILDQVKELNKKDIIGLKEDKNSYSTYRLLQEMAPNSKLSVSPSGTLENLEAIDGKNLAAYYQNVMKNDNVDVYIVGDIDEEKVTHLVETYLPFKTKRAAYYDAFTETLEEREEARVIREKDAISQAKLVIGCNIEDMSSFDLNFSLTLYTLILGGTPDSKFFKNIREKYSLCYYITASSLKLNHAMLFKAGIDSKNFDETLEHIRHEMKEMELGHFTDTDIESAKQTYLTMLKSITDSQKSMAYSVLLMKSLDLGTIEERRENILKVTKEQIMEIAKKIKINTIYLLEEASHEESGV